MITRILSLSRFLFFYKKGSTYIVSFFFHGLVIFAFLFTLPEINKKKPVSVPIINVEIVPEENKPTRKKDIAKKAEKPQEAKKFIREKQEVPEPPIATPAPPKEPPKPPKPLPAPKPDVVKEVAEIVPKPPQKKVTKEVKSHKQKAPTPPKSPPIPPKAPAKPLKKKLDGTALLKNIEKLAASANSDGKKLENKAKQEEKQASKHSDQEKEIAKKDTINADDLQRLRQQIISCWSIPSGARDLNKYSVDIHIFLDRERRVVRTKILGNAFQGDPFYKIFVESAERALYDIKCTPLDLPKEKYESWKEIIFTFDPKIF